jgi:hypothetical protein
MIRKMMWLSERRIAWDTVYQIVIGDEKTHRWDASNKSVAKSVHASPYDRLARRCPNVLPTTRDHASLPRQAQQSRS